MAGNEQVFAAIAAFRAKLARGEGPLFGTSVQLTDPTSTDALADSLDWFWFDQEHATMSPEALKTHIMVAHGRGTPCIVRIPAPNVQGSAQAWGTYIKQSLDMGADGVIVPQIRTADDVLQIVAATRPADSARPPTTSARPRRPRVRGRSQPATIRAPAAPLLASAAVASAPPLPRITAGYRSGSTSRAPIATSS